MKKFLKEDISITDPNLAQQYANAKQQLINKDQQINALNKQILRIQSEKIKIQATIDQIEKNSANQQNQQPQNQEPAKNVQPQQKNKDLETAQKQLAAQVLMNQPTSESLATMNIKNKISTLNEIAESDTNKKNEINNIINSINVGINESNSLSSNPFSVKEFYDAGEEDPYDYGVVYVEITENDNTFVGKIFKPHASSDWIGKLVSGESSTFERLTYKNDYEEDDIINFLFVNYEGVKVLSETKFNEYV